MHAQLKDAIDRNDLPSVQSLMLHDPALHRAPLGYAGDGPLTWLAECRIPHAAPNATRLAMAKWMIENGSDVHQGGDAPLMRAALDAERIPMMDLLVSHGADVNAAWHGTYPIIFAPCEALEPGSLLWLIEQGADPNPPTGYALDYLIGTYLRDPGALQTCLDILLHAGAKSKHNAPAVLAVIRRCMDELTSLLDADPSLLHRQFPSLDFGTTAARMLTLKGATLLHVASEYGNLEAAQLLLDRGADVNALGAYGQTPIYHASTQNHDTGLSIVQLLVARGARLNVRANVPGHYEKPEEILHCTPLEYALLFPGDQGPTSAFLKHQLLLNPPRIFP